jgi:hypothetical protein
VNNLTQKVDGWSKHNKTPNLEPFLGNQSVNDPISDPSDITQVVSAVIGDDFLQLFTEQSNLYHKQNVEKRKSSLKSLKLTDIISAETKKILGLILLMGQVRKDNVKDYWSTDPTITTPTFSQTMSRNRFEATWEAWHFNDNSQLKNDSSRLFKIEPVYEFLLQKFRSVYSPGQELSLDAEMILWRGSLRF